MVFELSAVMTLSTISFWVSPSSAACTRSTFSRSGGIVHVLRNVDLADAGQLADARGQILGDVVGAFQDRGC